MRLVDAKVFVPFEKGLSNSAGNTDMSIPTLPSRVGIRDVFNDPIGLGLRGHNVKNC